MARRLLLRNCCSGVDAHVSSRHSRFAMAGHWLGPSLHARRFASDEGGDLAAVHKSPIVKHLWGERARYARVTALEHKAQEILLTKTVADSQVEVMYNFKDDPLLRDQYANFNGLIQYSKLFEDFDALAGNVAIKHVDDDDPETRMPQLVTASVDKIRLAPGVAIDLESNYKMTGQVMWVGSSSMKIRMALLREDDSRSVLEAGFTFVARDVISKRGCKVNKLKPETEQEKLLFQQEETKNQEAKKARAAKMQQGSSGSVSKPSRRGLGEAASQSLDETEEALAKELLDQGRLLHDMPGLAVGDAVLIDQTKIQSVSICQPQQRNTAGRMFGGYLMRLAYRTAFPTAYMFAGSFPHFVECDEVTFLHPVEVGDICEFSGRVMLTYTKVRPVIHVEVVASVLKPDQKTSLLTNIFNFVFELRPKPGQALPTIKRVFPSNETGASRVVKIMTRHAA